MLSNPALFDTSITTRGFTGHEMIDPVGLVHMNGRVYDGEIGRFLSADPFVQDNTNSQALNRYTYVLNNPLSMTDPTGYFFGSVFKAIGNFIGKVFSGLASIFKAALKIPLIRAVIQIAACAGPGLSPLCVGVAGAMALLGGGGIEDAIKAMAFTVGSFGVWTGVGELITGPLQAAMGVAEGVLNAATVGFAAVKGAIHGVVGGALSLAQGGEFVDGFVANAAGAFAGVMAEGVFGPAGTGGLQERFGRIAAAGIAGGTASQLTGGKFANGAITAAFAQMWNGEALGRPSRSGVLRAALKSLTYPLTVALDAILGTERFYLTYILTQPGTGRVYVGRTSGFGLADDILYSRLISHYYYMVAGYTNVAVDQIAQGLGAYEAIRGREQQLVDFHGGVGSYEVANLIRPVSALNPWGRIYHDYSNRFFGPLARYTGYL
jgi:RHS repeat-associated protein